jgi:hypothetical protein
LVQRRQGHIRGFRGVGEHADGRGRVSDIVVAATDVARGYSERVRGRRSNVDLAKAHRSPSLSALLGQPATLGHDSVLIKRTTLRHLAKVPPARRAAILYLIKGRGMNGGGAGRGQRVGVGHDYEMMLLLCYCCC